MSELVNSTITLDGNEYPVCCEMSMRAEPVPYRTEYGGIAGVPGPKVINLKVAANKQLLEGGAEGEMTVRIGDVTLTGTFFNWSPYRAGDWYHHHLQSRGEVKVEVGDQ